MEKQWLTNLVHPHCDNRKPGRKATLADQQSGKRFMVINIKKVKSITVKFIHEWRTEHLRTRFKCSTGSPSSLIMENQISQKISQFHF